MGTVVNLPDLIIGREEFNLAIKEINQMDRKALIDAFRVTMMVLKGQTEMVESWVEKIPSEDLNVLVKSNMLRLQIEHEGRLN